MLCYVYQDLAWLKKMDSISYIYISWFVQVMWKIYIAFERKDPNFQNIIPRALAWRTILQQRQLRTKWFLCNTRSFAFVSSLKMNQRLLLLSVAHASQSVERVENLEYGNKLSIMFRKFWNFPKTQPHIQEDILLFDYKVWISSTCILLAILWTVTLQVCPPWHDFHTRFYEIVFKFFAATISNTISKICHNGMRRDEKFNSKFLKKWVCSFAATNK